MSGRGGKTPFDPRPHLRRLDNGAEYLDVKWRLHWMRSEHPDAQIETELMKDDDDGALFKAVVRLPEGGSAMAHAGAPRQRDTGHIEQAETKAVGRALAALGYGAEYTEDDAAPAEAPERPAPPQLSTLRPGRERPQATEPAREAPSEPNAEREPRRFEEPRPLTRYPEGRPAGEEPAPAPSPAATTAPEAAGGETEDVSWNKFWVWAKRRGYRDASQLRELLGDDIMSHTPNEVRNLLRRYELDHPPPGSQEP